VVKKADGTFATDLSQRGTVDAVGATYITVKSGRGFGHNPGHGHGKGHRK
jgi:hypothetical protein